MTGADLRAARAALGLSQRALATRLGVTQATVWRWEHGTTAIEHPKMLELAIWQLVDILGTRPAASDEDGDPDF